MAFAMIKGEIMKIITVALLLLSATSTTGQWFEVHIECEAGSTPVSICNRPDGLGQSLAEAGATVYVWITDFGGDPLQGFPAEDIWLECVCSGTFGTCNPCGACADHSTDPNGMTVFADPLEAGGWCYEEGDSCFQVVVALFEFPVPNMNLYMNSADINGDLVVNIQDIAYFTQTLYGEYQYRADLMWDGVINLSDAVLMTQGNGMACP